MDGINERFEYIYEQTKHEIYRYITVKCRCIDDIDDLFQDTYVSVYQYLKNGGDITEPAGFVKTVAKRTLGRYYGLLKRLKLIEERLSSVEIKADDHDELVDVINELVMKAPPMTQKIFFMRHSLQMPFDEIADRLDMKTNTVQKIYYRTTDNIRRRLEKEELL